MSQYTRSGVLDVTSKEFDVDAYMSMQLKEKSLDQLLKEEEEMVSSVRRLDSDVHQLVYENYNKFLTATNTVRKIQEEFNNLDSELGSLKDSMNNISTLIGKMGGVLGEQRSDLAQLGSSYKVISSLAKFIFDLPNILKSYLDERKYADFARVYLLAKNALGKYSDVQNVTDIISKVDQMEKMAIQELTQTIKTSEDVEIIEENVELLTKLGISEETLEQQVLETIKNSLSNDLSTLREGSADVLDLVDKGCGSFVPNLTLFATMHLRLFPSQNEILISILQNQLQEFHSIVSSKFLSSTDPKDCSIVVRALDRYFRKMSTCKHVVPGLDCFPFLLTLIKSVSRHQIDISCRKINEEMKSVSQEARQLLINETVQDLSLLSSRIEQAFTIHVKTAMANLLMFIASDVTFSNVAQGEFQTEFAQDVHEMLLVKGFNELAIYLESFGFYLSFPQNQKIKGTAEGQSKCNNPWLLLMFAVTLNNVATKSSGYLLNLCREQLSLTSVEKTATLTSANTVLSILKSSAHLLLRSFVQQRGMQLGESLIKGCEALAQPTASPTGVRAAVRRAVEEVGECDRLLGLLMGADQRKENRPRRPADAPRDSLWCDRIDFHQQIHFNKASIVTSIIKVLLKSFTEGIRQQTYNRMAVEQIQVDCCYLQRWFSPLVADEVIVNSMVDQTLSSALKRCLNPVLIHPSKLSVLCEDKE